MATFTTSTVIKAPHEAVWTALADIGSISIWNPGVEASHSTSDALSGLGATRQGRDPESFARIVQQIAETRG